MTKIKKKEITYIVEQSKKELIVTDGEVKLRVKIDKNYIHILPTQDNKFIFMSENNLKTVKRWSKIIDCLKQAVIVLEEERLI